jgi:TonB-linked SusC/RagA family outer membrane protein
MNKKHTIRGFLIGCLSMIAPALPSGAQEIVAPSDSTTTAEQNPMPGHLFATNPYNNTSASATVQGDKLSLTISPNLINTLGGQLPGLVIRQGNGIPGADNTGWLIRGIGSYGYGRESESKLFVDGFEVNSEYLIYLTPSEIESVTVLKDAAALATFGMRGSNGVIWVETKRGKAGKPTISAHLVGSLQMPVNISKPLNSFEYASLYNQARSNDNAMTWSPYYSEEELANYRNNRSPNVDWFDQVLKNQGSYLNSNISFNGGNQTARYNAVLGYADQQGLLNVDNDDSMSNLKMDRFNLRTNLDLNLFEFLEAKIDLSGRIENRKGPNFDTGTLMDNLMSYPSNIYNVYDDEEQENFSGTSLYKDNPVGSIKGLGWQSSRLRILQGNFLVKEKLDFIVPGLYLQQAFSFYSRSTSTYNKTRNYARYFDGAPTTTDENTSLVAGGYGSAGMNDWKQGLVTAAYSQSFGKQTIHSALNFHLSDYKGDGRFGYKYHYLNYSGRVNYAYDNRYAAEAGFSYFGSDSYAPGKRFGFYPALSAAWIISGEPFMKSYPAIRFLKLRASAGRTGGTDSGETGNLSAFNSNGRFLYEQYYYYTGGFNSGNSTPYQWNSGLAPLFIANRDAKAEQSMKYDAGLELNLLGKLSLTADIFLDKRSDILTFNQSIMGYYGQNYYLSNIGRMTNKGFELSAVFSDKAGEAHYSLFAMASYAKNVIDYSGEIPKAYSYNAYTGRPYGTQIGLVAEGFYQLSDFNADGSLKDGLPVSSYGKVQPGDLKYQDLDGDGFIDDTDVTKIGDPSYPPLAYAFGGNISWKGFDLDVLFRGAYGASVNLMDYGNRFIAFMDNRNAYEIAKGAWAYYPDQNIDTRRTATYPRLSAANNENNYRPSSFWIRHNDFLRLQHIELGYHIAPAAWRSKDISQLRIFLNATNPVTWSSLLTDYDMDPETSFGYPSLKSFSAGISFIF